MSELEGFEVAVAGDGVEGMKKATEWLPDLILMDLDGFEAIEKIRESGDTLRIPIIAISAWASGKHKKRALDAGANEHFTKPVDLNRLMTTINNYLKENSA